MTYVVRYTQGALDDLDRLFDYLLLRDTAFAEKACKAIEKATGFFVDFPFSCWNASSEMPFSANC